MARDLSAGNRFDGGSALGNTPTLPLFLAAWVNPDTITGCLMGKGGSSGWAFNIATFPGFTNIGFTKFGVADINSGFSISTGAWTFVAVTVTATQCKFRKWDGTTLTANTVANSGTISSSAVPLGIGNNRGEVSDASMDGKVEWAMAAEGFDPSDATVKAIAIDPRSFLRHATIAGASSKRLWPLWGVHSSEIDLSSTRTTLTTVGSPPAIKGAPVAPVHVLRASNVEVAAGGGATTQTVTFSLDAAIQRQITVATAMNAAVQVTSTATAQVDAAIQAARTISSNLDASVLQTRTLLVNLDAALQQARSAITNLDAAVQTNRTASVSADSAIRASRTATANVDAFIQAGFQVQATVDAAIQITRSVAVSLDAGIQSTRSVGAALNAAIQVSGALNALMDAAVQINRTAGTSLTAAIQQTRTVSTALDAQIVTGFTVTAMLDAAVQTAHTALAWLDAYISDPSALPPVGRNFTAPARSGFTAPSRDGFIVPARGGYTVH